MEQKNKGSCITFWMRGRRSAQPVPKTWCLTTKEQGFAGSEAPRHRGSPPPCGRSARKLQTIGAGTVPSPTPAEPRPAAGGLAVRQQPHLPPADAPTKKGPTHSRSS